MTNDSFGGIIIKSQREGHASVAQLVEQRTENPRVVGSIPIGGTIYADLAHLVERDLAKVEVAGSSPVIRSTWKLSSAGRASALQAEGHRFEPCTPHQNFLQAVCKDTAR